MSSPSRLELLFHLLVVPLFSQPSQRTSTRRLARLSSCSKERAEEEEGREEAPPGPWTFRTLPPSLFLYLLPTYTLRVHYEPARMPTARPLGSQAPTDTEHSSSGRYATLIALHGMLGFLAFQVVAPAAAIVAAVGKGWSNGLWFRMHWKIQVFVTVPTVTLAITVAVIAASMDDRTRVYDKHRTTGFVLLGVLILQLALGYYAHSRHQAVTTFATSSGLPAPPPKRRVANWLHMGVGVGLLTVGGLQVMWGLAGVPPLIVTPYILIRGIKRLRAGHSFTESFFSTPPSSQPYQPPRKLFLGTSTYIDEAYAPGAETVLDADADVEKDGVGHEYAKGKGVDGRVQVESSWPGAATRKEYEHEVQSSIGHGSVVGSTIGGESTYDDYRDRREEEEVSLIKRAAPIARLPSPGADEDEGRPTVSPPSVGENLTFSPRLSFTPFAGPDVINPPTLTLATSPSPALSTTEAVLRDQPDGEGQSAKTPTLVPTPPLPSSAQDKADVRATDTASPAPQLTSDGVLFTVERRPSQVAKVEGEASNQEVKPAAQEETVVEEDEDDDVILADDSESTRLMDELERELTISPMRSGRSRAAPAEEEKLAEVGESAKEEPMLEREQSGKWFGNGRAAS
ncbi:Proteophosphoglycan 5 [Rhodotorula toruloides ATCC 204091]|uniref:Proteophosphoglycan 5 n=1 Tax=Rhodotorula toruloides TaxID=5286 RepID=A0A2T0A8N0_RHOTO|nr:Proteophosphoglycan 5 [Rhodotorula toruloides ATCC 204091]PRQ74377.1 Proteophosphoglycan 5 [Rhodotorula toruloides]